MELENKLKPEVKKLWCEALRSGEYKQGKHALTIVNDDGTEENCCLGVLCKVAIKNGLDVAIIGKESVCYTLVKAYNNEYQILPLEVAKWAGIFSSNLRVKIGDECTVVAEHNDNGRTFAEIADAIEQQL